jgi:hypothetical protein
MSKCFGGLCGVKEIVPRGVKEIMPYGVKEIVPYGTKSASAE